MNALPPPAEDVHRYVPVRLCIAIDDKQLLDYFLWDMDRLHQNHQQRTHKPKANADTSFVFFFFLLCTG